jgi:branched-chain amino acid transport system substrate-binding protein
MRSRSSLPRLSVALLAVLALLVAGCAAPEDAGGAGTEDDAGAADPAPDTPAAPEGTAAEAEGEAEDGPILVGLNIELSGGAAVQGQAYVNAAELWVSQANADGGIMGREVELEVLDNGSEQTEAVVLTRQLADRGATAMIGPGTSPTTLAAMDAILETGIPTFSMGSAEAIVEPASDRPNVFKTPVGSGPNVHAATEYLTGQGIDAVGLIAVNNPYGDSGIAAWEEATAQGDAGIELVGVERFEGDDTDMTAQLNNLVGAGAGAIAVVAIPPGAPTVRRNAIDSLGLDLPMIFDAGAGAELFIELAGSAADGALVTHPPTLIWDEVASDDPQHEALQAFGTAYTSEYDVMSGFAGYAWDALGLLRAAIEEAGSTESAAIVGALEGLGEYVGVNGVYELSADDHQGLDAEALRILTVTDGEWTVLEGDAGGA